MRIYTRQALNALADRKDPDALAEVADASVTSGAIDQEEIDPLEAFQSSTEAFEAGALLAIKAGKRDVCRVNWAGQDDSEAEFYFIGNEKAVKKLIASLPDAEDDDDDNEEDAEEDFCKVCAKN